MSLKHLLISLLFLMLFCSIQAQKINYSGKVVDSLQQPLAYANIIAIPETDEKELSFAITNAEGEFKLHLHKNSTYNITTSFLGYQSDSIKLTPTADIKKNIILYANTSVLDEVVLNYTIPVVVKKDTITYTAASFTTGEERKLQDVLKKLPGVTVNKKGTITVNGKKVTKVLVEGKTFFTGSSKLALENLPAEVINKIEVLDNYNDVAMLKDLEDTNDMALNVKLKEDKKQFVFGNVNVGAGIKERYKIHPSLFYYNPKTTVNFIADVNNSGTKSFTVKEYLDFEGGMGRLLNNPEKYFNLYNSDIVKFIENDAFYSNKDKFAAVNLKKAVNSKLDVSTYMIASKTESLFKTTTQNYYINSGTSFLENRTNFNTSTLFFGLGKLRLNYKPNSNTDVQYSSFFKNTNPINNNSLTTQYLATSNAIQRLDKANNLTVKNSFNCTKKLADKHIIVAELVQDYKKETPRKTWKTNQEILQGVVPLLNDSFYSIIQDKQLEKNALDFVAKHYWKTTPKHHFYTSIGFTSSSEKLVSKEYQYLTNGTENNFSSNNFGNAISYKLFNPYLKLAYKTKIGLTTITPALSYQLYIRNISQFSGKQHSTKVFIAPSLKAKTEFSSSQKITYQYALATRFPTIEYLANRYTLTNFNSVFMGDDKLENSLYHNFSLRYYRFSMYRKMNITASLSYRKRNRSLKKEITLTGIESIMVPVLLNQPEYNWSFDSGVSKRVKKIKYFFKAAYHLDTYNQLINTAIKKNKMSTSKFTVGATSYFKKFPNLAVNFSKAYDKFGINDSSTKYVTNAIEVNLEYDFKGIIFKTDYSLNQNSNKNTKYKNNYEHANVSLFYQKKNSAWGFELTVANVLNQKNRQENYFSDYLITETYTKVFPRTIMFELSYKL